MPRASFVVLASVMLMFGGCIHTPDDSLDPPSTAPAGSATSTTLAAAPALELKPWPGAEAPEPGFESIFNGKDLSGWKTDHPDSFAVKEGAIGIQVGPGLLTVQGHDVLEVGKGVLLTVGAYKDFDLRAEFRLPVKGADSGIFFRIDSTRYQVQTKDADDLGEIRSFKVTQKHDKEATARLRKPVGEWQSFDILVHGEECWVKLNGELVTYATGLSEQSGPIGLQAEGFPVEFRNLRVKKLK